MFNKLKDFWNKIEPLSDQDKKAFGWILLGFLFLFLDVHFIAGILMYKGALMLPKEYFVG